MNLACEGGSQILKKEEGDYLWASARVRGMEKKAKTVQCGVSRGDTNLARWNDNSLHSGGILPESPGFETDPVPVLQLPLPRPSNRKPQKIMHKKREGH